MRHPLVGWIRVGRVAGLDVINRRNRWVAEGVINRDRRRLVKGRRIIVVEHIRVAGGIFWILRNDRGVSWKVKTQLNKRRRIGKARLNRQLKIGSACCTRRCHRSVIVDREDLQVLALIINHVTVIVNAERTVTGINRLARGKAWLHRKEALTRNCQIESVQ